MSNPLLDNSVPFDGVPVPIPEVGVRDKAARRVLGEITARMSEALRLWEPLPFQEAFHRSTAPVRLLTGGNQQGKTTPGMVEVAWAVTGTHPYLSYPKEDGKVWLVARDQIHIADPFYRKLCRPGLFKIIKDEQTKRWRSWRPWQEYDQAYSEKSKDAPPLIPPRLIKRNGKDIAWYSKKEYIFSMIPLITGWEIWAFPAGGPPQMGAEIDIALMDEHIPHPEWYPEMAARLVKRNGKMIWPATPLSMNVQIVDLMTAAAKTAKDQNPRIANFQSTLDGNKYLTEEAKTELKAKYENDPEAYRVRILGMPAITGYSVLPGFHMDIHGFDLADIGGRVPDDWTRYMVVDPGHQVCAVLFAAVPPPEATDIHGRELGDIVLCYDELYLRDCDAHKFGVEVASKIAGDVFYEFLIDMHGASHTSAGDGMTVEWHYTRELEKRRIECEQTGSEFIPGLGDQGAVDRRLQHCREWIHTRKIRVAHGMLPNFEREITFWHKKRLPNGMIEDKPDAKCPHHIMDCFDSETQVLTREGWRHFAALDGSELLATVSLETNAIEYQEPIRLVRKPYKGEMIRFGGRKMDALVTPTHRMVVYERPGGEAVIKEAQNLGPMDCIKLHARWDAAASRDPVLIPRSFNGLREHEKEMDREIFAEFLGWYVAEGCCEKTIRCPGRGYRVTVSQQKPQGRERLEKLFSHLPWKWNTSGCNYYTSSKQLWEYVRPLGKSGQKYVPQWIKDSSEEVISAFLRGVLGGDGWTVGSSRCHATISERLADDMQELFLKVGSSASVSRKRAMAWSIRGRSGGSKEQFHTREWTRAVGGLRDSKGEPNFSSEFYEGEVFCATVPNSTLIVRRNGRPMIAGNCFGYLAAHEPEYHKPNPRHRVSKVYASYKRFKERMDRMQGIDDRSIVIGLPS